MGIGLNQALIGRIHGMVKIAGADEPTIHEKILLAPGALRPPRGAHKTRNLHDIGILLYRQ